MGLRNHNSGEPVSAAGCKGRDVVEVENTPKYGIGACGALGIEVRSSERKNIAWLKIDRGG